MSVGVAFGYLIGYPDLSHYSLVTKIFFFLILSSKQTYTQIITTWVLSFL
nr:MAG TPA: hypothetical protein [Caudoviricetes sp.]